MAGVRSYPGTLPRSTQQIPPTANQKYSLRSFAVSLQSNMDPSDIAFMRINLTVVLNHLRKSSLDLQFVRSNFVFSTLRKIGAVEIPGA
jgi:hypothetical protein